MEGLTEGRRNTSGEKRMKLVANGLALAGFLIVFIGSRFVGMSLTAKPYISCLTILLWIISIYCSYLAFLKGGKVPKTAATWIKVCAFIGAYSSLLLTLAVLFGYLFYFTVEKSFIAKGNAVFLMISLFVMGLAIDGSDWKRIAKSPRVIGMTVLIRWICLPIAAYVIAYFAFIRLIPDPVTARNLTIGLIIVGAGPTGTTSNALTMIADGDLAMSVTVTGLNTLLTPFVLPVITLLFVGSMAHMELGKVIVDLLEIVLAPVVLGSLLGSIFVKQLARFKPALGPCAVIALGFIMMGTMSKGAATLIKHLYVLPYLAVGVGVFVLVGYAIGWFAPKHLGFNLKQRKAACFEIGATNAAVTLVLALRHFDPLAVVVSILYGKIMVIAGATLIVPLLQKAKDKPPAHPAPGAEYRLSPQKGPEAG